ncbi:MAG: glucose-1-phosphate cytidylyltransferase [Ignavibacteriae bacterium]|nr:glucose-1-phosphate cytidylyltransferase [Ignavibacteriota bacterium]NOH00335.1 glucose-1-phosphate cytidylyltransferase [Ignavibacteriota bacterium]
MKVVILAGGYGTRLSEETTLRPKPMVEIGGMPILWHIMKYYSYYGFNDFIICLGYKGYVIKEYFANYFLHQSNVTFDIENNKMEIHKHTAEPWKVTLIDTGQNTGTGGRLRKVKEYIGEEDFCFTYGDGVSNIDISKLVRFHKENNKLVTVTAIQPPVRYGVLIFDDQQKNITSFEEKPEGESGWINGGFFVLSPKAIDYIKSDKMMWEHDPIKSLVAENQLSAFVHHGFWYAMDSLRDKNKLEELWESGKAPWKVW